MLLADPDPQVDHLGLLLALQMPIQILDLVRVDDT